MLRRPAQPAARQRGLGSAGQLPRRADRLPAARRAAGLDRRHRGVRPDRGLPVRRRRLPRATGCSTSTLEQAARRRHGAVRRAGRAEVRSTTRRSSRPRTAPRSGATPRSGCRGRCWQAYGDVAVLADALPGHGRPRPTGRALLVADRAVGQPASSSATGSIPTAPPERAVRGQGRQRRRRDRVPVTAAPSLVAEAAELLGRDDGRRAVRRRWPSGPGRPSPTHYVHADGTIAQRRPDRVRAGDRVRAARREPHRVRPATDWPSWWPRAATASPPASPAPRIVTDALTADRSPRRRLPAAAADRVPVLALPGDDGRHHDLGALGLDAARRHHQPGRDDQLQPLRPRRGGRLDAPHHRRDRPRRARLPDGAGRAAAGRRHRPGRRRRCRRRTGWWRCPGPTVPTASRWRSRCRTASPRWSTCRISPSAS